MQLIIIKLTCTHVTSGKMYSFRAPSLTLGFSRVSVFSQSVSCSIVQQFKKCPKCKLVVHLLVMLVLWILTNSLFVCVRNYYTERYFISKSLRALNPVQSIWVHSDQSSVRSYQISEFKVSLVQMINLLCLVIHIFFSLNVQLNIHKGFQKSVFSTPEKQRGDNYMYKTLTVK